MFAEQLDTFNQNNLRHCHLDRAPDIVISTEQKQHFKNISRYLAPTGVKAALLTGSSRTAERREIQQGLQDGSIGIIVGTHALIEDSVQFRRLGLAIVDEQHRFGVEQRAKLWRSSSRSIPMP